ncbi:MAG: alpha/beta hydrolase [Saprospiraceae bacterium]|nr:MAG: alpha/beta hydrolase [Saprospiraceae bacterium]
MIDNQNIDTDQRIEKPSTFRFIGEHLNVWKELWDSFVFQRKHQVSTGGDGHPVLVIPGFMGSDLSTRLLRRFIRKLGYTPYAWELGRNLGDVSQLNILKKKIEDIHAKHDAKVSLIGWSLGGVYARQLAKNNPDLIRQIITLSSPFAGIEKPNNAAWLYKLINSRRTMAEKDEKWVEDIASPASVPTTAIYSKEDGIVPWQTCMEQKVDKIHQNIEVKGGHIGLAYNPSVWLIVEDRLQYSQENWTEFFDSGKADI